MRRRRRGLLAATVIGAPLVYTVGVAGEAVALNVVAVTTTTDVDDGSDGVLSLREAFSIANGDGDDTEIVLAAGELYRLCDEVGTSTDEDANADGDLDHVEPNDLLISGNDAEIRSQCPGERVIHNLHEDGSIELRDLLVAGGDLGVGDQGSGLFSAGNTVIDSVTFTDNTGGVAVEVGDFGAPADLVVTGSEFSDNRGGVRVNSGIASVTDTDFVFNQTAAITANFSTLTVTNALVRENGAGINGIDGTVTVTDSEVRDNFGVGIRNTGNDDTGYPLSVTDTTVERNEGGGVQCSFCTSLTITDSTIADNEPTDGFGGSGVFFRQNLDGPSATITGSVISGNTAAEHGGGVYAEGDGVVPSMTITNTTIAGNRAGLFGDGGGIYALSVDLTIDGGSHIDGNFAKPEGLLVGGSGGGLALSDGGSLVVADSTIDDNFADNSGGGVSLLGVPTATFTSASLSDNVADGFGGGGFEAAGDGSLYSFVESTIAGNSARLAGGGISVVTSGAGVEVLLDRSTVSDNTTTNSNGGGVFTNTPASSLTLRNSTVTGNSSPFIGGGLAALSTGSINLEHATVVDNSAPETANVRHQAGALTSFGSVIALAQGGGNDCDTFSGATVSQGYNFSGAATCGFGAGAGDQPAGGDPVIGPLTSVGGPTAVRVPLGGSSLVSAVPPAACTLVTVDQRNAARPLGAGCEIGSVELVTGGLIAVADFAVVPAGRRTPTVINVLANDYDPGRRLRPATLRIVQRPHHGKAASAGNGRVLYLADRRFVGTDTFTYEVCTAKPRGRKADCVRAVVTVTVQRAASPR